MEILFIGLFIAMVAVIIVGLVRSHRRPSNGRTGPGNYSEGGGDMGGIDGGGGAGGD